MYRNKLEYINYIFLKKGILNLSSMFPINFLICVKVL